MAESIKPTGKKFAIISNIVVVLFLIAGLIFPIGAKSVAAGIDFKNMPVLQLGGALANLGLNINFGTALSEGYSLPVTLFGQSFDVGALLLLLYAVATLVSLIIFVCSLFTKKNKMRAVRAIFVGEAIALTVLLPMSAIALFTASDINLSVLVPFGVTYIVLAVQSIYYRRGSGVIKIILSLLSAVAVYAALSAIWLAPFEKLAQSISGVHPFDTVAGLYALDGVTYTGKHILKLAVAGGMRPAGAGISVAIANWTAFIIIALACLNLYLDILGMGKETTKGMLRFNVIRYALQLLLLAVLLTVVVIAGGSYGIFTYILLLMALVQLIIQLLRRIGYKKSRAAELEREEKFDEDADIADSDEEYAFDSEEKEQPAGKEVVETRNVVYNVNTIYNGPTDNFIRKLTTDQKIEFARLFLENHPAQLRGIPDYIVGGDNSRFFSSLFIYFSRVRDLVTDGLMNKFYEEVKMI